MFNRREVGFDVCSKSNSLGPHHKENQDSFLVDDKNLLFAVADGVGGYFGAKEASSLAIKHLEKSAKSIVDEKSLSKCIQEIHAHILRISQKLLFPNMGTTIAVAKVLLPSENKDSKERRDCDVLLANVGDSPILMLKEDSLMPVYFDDSFRSKDPISMYGITQYVGLDCPIEIHTREIKCEEKGVGGTSLLLCSDGITDNLLLKPDGTAKLVSLMKLKSAEKIVDAAIEEGTKPDDMTAVLMFF